LNLFFPTSQIFDYYTNLEDSTDTSREPFSWGVPNTEKLTEFTLKTFGWNKQKSEQTLGLALNRYNSLYNKQQSLDQYFHNIPKVENNFNIGKGKLSKVVKLLKQRYDPNLCDNEIEEEGKKPKRVYRKRKKEEKDEEGEIEIVEMSKNTSETKKSKNKKNKVEKNEDEKDLELNMKKKSPAKKATKSPPKKTTRTPPKKRKIIEAASEDQEEIENEEIYVIGDVDDDDDDDFRLKQTKRKRPSRQKEKHQS
jgi:hypothetical protein